MSGAEERRSAQRAPLSAILAALPRHVLLLLQLVLVSLVVAYLGYFAAHVWLLLPYPYPLDYGEGPLLAQIELLRAGTPVWRIYGDPGQPPYVVVNYPPLYLLLTAALSNLTGSVLVAGRLLSLLATLGCVAALAVLVRVKGYGLGVKQTTGRRLRGDGPRVTPIPNPRPPTPDRRSPTAQATQPATVLYPSLLFLTIPIVREWGVLVRVDMLGACLGLWGLVALRQAVGGKLANADQSPVVWAAVAGILFLLALYTKPSLIAAPLAGCVWLGLKVMGYGLGVRGCRFIGRWTMDDGRQRARHTIYGILTLLAVLALGGGGLFALLQWASDGWFALHVVAANANRWDAELAWQFWLDQARLRWPLAVAAVLSIAVCAVPNANRKPHIANLLALPLLYTVFGIVTASGVGKVGAYANYFLELYAGLVWLVALGMREWSFERRMSAFSARLPLPTPQFPILVLLIAGLLYYPPVWSETQLRRAGLLEPSPPRLAFGRYNLWEDTRREAQVLAALGRVQTELVRAVQAAGPVIFTDIPGVATQAGALYRLQVFEQRQLLDQGLWDQRELLRELANGELPLAVIDFLGNWLTPEMIELLQRRYAHDGSFGTFDLYRPVDPGPLRPIDLTFGDNLRLHGYHLAEPPGSSTSRTFAPGELLVVTLEWRRDLHSPVLNSQSPVEVVLRLTDTAGNGVAETTRPLVYGALPSDAWPGGASIQHMQPLPLPTALPAGTYELALTLRNDGHDQSPARALTQITVGSPQGRHFAETNFFVPAPFLRAWNELGGVARAGYPLTPTVPFAWGTLQCFERVCLELREGAVRQRPLGAQHYLAETLRHSTCLDSDAVPAEQDRQASALPDPDSPPAPPEVCPAFRAAWQRFGGTDSLGPPLSGELWRSGWIVQWTRYARLERQPGSEEVGLGRLGDDTLRLPPGMRYRWP